MSLFLTSAIGLGGGAVSAQDASGGWVFTSLPSADLWFHGMALVDPIGPGPNPLYDPGYPTEVRRVKEKAGLSATVLDRRSGYFRDTFRGDPAFEVLHFLPLYFAQAGRTEVFAALTLLAETEDGIPRAPSARTAFGLAAVGSVLTAPNQRSILGEFITALEAEWDEFFEAWWREESVQRGRTQVSLQNRWSRDFGPALDPVLDGIGMSGGLVALVPSIGLEGRIFGGAPQSTGDNVLVVSAPASSENGSEAVFSMLREISFPPVRRVMDRTGTGVGGPDEEERLAARAAIRSGALILEMCCPDDVMDYRLFFLSRAGRSAPTGAAIEAVFKEVFSLEPDLEKALREEILSTVTDGGKG